MLISIFRGLFYVATFEALLAMIFMGFQPITLLAMLVPMALILTINVLECLEGAE